METPIDTLLKNGWVLKEKDMYADTGDEIYIIYKIINGKAKVFSVIIGEKE